MAKPLHILAGLLLACIFAPVAMASCESYELEAVQRSSPGYDASNPVAGRVELELRVIDGDLPKSCRGVQIQIEIVGGTARDPALFDGANRLEAVWERSTALLRNGDHWRIRQSARRDLVDGQAVSFTLYHIDPGQFIAPGQYRQNLRITTGNQVTILPIIVEVEPSLRFERESVFGVHTLDLGDVTDGASASANFYFRTNTALSVTLHSENAGALVHERGPAFGRIVYRAALSGRVVDLTGGLSQPVELAYGAGLQTGQLQVTTPPSPNQFAGQYRDVVTLSFIPY